MSAFAVGNITICMSENAGVGILLVAVTCCKKEHNELANVVNCIWAGREQHMQTKLIFSVLQFEYYWTCVLHHQMLKHKVIKLLIFCLKILGFHGKAHKQAIS